MNVNQLSERLRKVADYLPRGAYFADIGSDHAYLPCYVCLHDGDAKAVAGEVNQGPYESAWNEVRSHGLENRIDVRLGDGLQVVEPGEIQQVVVAGMGGPLIRDILNNGEDKLSRVNRIVVQPNIDARSLRRWFYERGFQLVAEEILEENGHIYEILVAEKGDAHAPYSEVELEKELWLGPFLMRQKNEVFQKKWEEELNKKQKILEQIKQSTKDQQEKIKEFEQEIQWLEEVLN
ncbi:tRNA (adenine-N(1))-methyltransferase [Halobacillus fulvus]|nr:tRNA (adenine-N(1))-methyltransferase [Halobacillus fulvus]